MDGLEPSSNNAPHNTASAKLPVPSEILLADKSSHEVSAHVTNAVEKQYLGGLRFWAVSIV